MIKSDGEIDKKYNYKFSIKKIRVLTFETDYFKSVKLMMEDKINENNKK